MRMLEPEGVGSAENEVAHRPRGQQRIAAQRMTEPRQVDRHQMGVLGEPRPHRLEHEQALRPRAEQQGLLAAVLAESEPDRQPVDDPEPYLEGRVQPGGHGTAPPSRAHRRLRPSDCHLATAALGSARCTGNWPAEPQQWTGGLARRRG